MRWSYPANSALPIPVLDEKWEPPALDDGVLDEAKAKLAELDRYLAPVGDPEWLSERITALMAHAFVPDMDEGAWSMFMADWAIDLRPFPKWAIQDMAGELRQGDRRGITLSAAVAVCRRLTAEARFERDALWRLVDPGEQERARRRREEAAAAARREEEHRAFVAERLAADPDWSPLKDALRRIGEQQQLEESDAQGSA